MTKTKIPAYAGPKPPAKQIPIAAGEEKDEQILKLLSELAPNEAADVIQVASKQLLKRLIALNDANLKALSVSEMTLHDFIRNCLEMEKTYAEFSNPTVAERHR